MINLSFKSLTSACTRRYHLQILISARAWIIKEVVIHRDGALRSLITELFKFRLGRVADARGIIIVGSKVITGNIDFEREPMTYETHFSISLYKIKVSIYEEYLTSCSSQKVFHSNPSWL